MKFMITWRIHEDRRHEALKRFSEMSEEQVENEFGELNMIGRWHDLIGFTGTAIVETSDPNALNAWLIQWNHMVDIETTPVLDDKEAREFGRNALS